MSKTGTCATNHLGGSEYSAVSHAPSGRNHAGTLEYLNNLQDKLQNAPLFIDDSPNMSLMEIRAKCRRLKQTNDLKLVVIDYLQLMTSGKAVESRQQEVSDFSRALKLLAKELKCRWALSQLNRGPEMRQDKKPQLWICANPVLSNRTPTWCSSCTGRTPTTRKIARARPISSWRSIVTVRRRRSISRSLAHTQVQRYAAGLPEPTGGIAWRGTHSQRR